jgi:hypothetical protein
MPLLLGVIVIVFMKKSKYSIILFSSFVLLSLTLLFVFASSSTNILFSQTQSITHNITENNTKDNQKFVFDSESKPYGISYAEWASKWWQWAYSVPKNINPAYDNT